MDQDPDYEASELARVIQEFADVVDMANVPRDIRVTITGPDGTAHEVEMGAAPAGWIHEVVQAEIAKLDAGLQGKGEDDIAGDVWGI